MKKTLMWLLVVTVIVSVVSLFSVSGCGAVDEVVDEEVAEEIVGEEEVAEEEMEEKDSADFEVVVIVKADGIPWFDVLRKGMEKCAEDYGFSGSVVGPPKADAALQAQMVEDYIARGVDAIAVVPNDPSAIEPVFAKANDQGIQTYGHEGSTFENVSFDIEAMSNENFGVSIMKSGIEYTGGEGKYVASVGWLTSVSHNEWVDAEIAYQQENAPDFLNALGYEEGSDRFEEQEDQSLAHDKILEFINTYPELSLVIGSPMTTGPAAALAIEEKNLVGELMFVGTGLPITIGSYLIDETVQEGFFWDPYMVGYALGYVSLNTWMGNPPEAGDAVVNPDGDAMPGYEKLDIITNDKGGKVIFGQGQISITKDNVREWAETFAEYGWPQEL